VFGYVITNCKTLSEEQRIRFKSFYCGMCRTLRERHGNLERFTLSYDMTFLAIALSALYEPEESIGRERCLAHPFKAHDYAVSKITEYAADMNIALAYHKCIDNWQDDHNPFYGFSGVALRSAYKKVCAAWPVQCRAIEEWMNEIRKIELAGIQEIDPPMNLTGKMLGTLFQYDPSDFWADQLYKMGDGLGRFIYFMDAYDDLKKDIKKKNYNPLKNIMHQDNFEDLCRDGLMMMMADCADAFEQLPVVRDAELIRNILYSGVWSKYGYIQVQRAKSKGAK